MELSTIIKNNCIFDLNKGCSNKKCNKTHLPNSAFKKECIKYINTPSNIPKMTIDIDTFRKVVKEKSKGYDLRHKIVVCVSYITNQECYNCSSGRITIINVKYSDCIIPVKICYRNISKCKGLCTWGMHIDLIYQNCNNKLKYIEPQFESISFEKPIDKKPIDEKPIDEKPIDEKPIDKKPIDEKPIDKKPIDKKPIDEKPKYIEQYPSLPSRKKDTTKKIVESVELVADVIIPIPKKKWVVNRELPFTAHDLIDKYAEILVATKMKMIHQIDKLQEESNNFLKRNVALVDEINAHKLIPVRCIACDHCHKTLGTKLCRGCFIKDSPNLMSILY